MVHIDEAALERAAQDLAKQVEVGLNKVLAQTQDEMAGRPAGEIRPVLEQRLRSALPQYHPGGKALDEWAEKISAAG